MKLRSEYSPREIEACVIAMRDLFTYLRPYPNIEVDIKAANVTACFVMKGIALGERTGEKDAYDLYMLARYYKEGPQSVLSELKKLGNHGLMKEALGNIEEQFKDVRSIGPVSVATFMGITDREEFDRITRDAYELLQFIIRGMKNK